MAKFRVVTLDGSENVIEDTELQEFRNGLKGASFVANDDGHPFMSGSLQRSSIHNFLDSTR